jgi:hypothetical protein
MEIIPPQSRAISKSHEDSLLVDDLDGDHRKGEGFANVTHHERQHAVHLRQGCWK